MDSRDVAPSLPQSNPDADAVPDLLRRAVSGVLRNAQNGDLPLFAWTLGMPQPELLALLARLFPEVDPVESMPDAQYQKLLRMCPPDFAAMLTLLLANRNPVQPERLTRWLAHAIAAACYGERELWEDLDLGGRDDLGQLLQQYFPACPPAQRSQLETGPADRVPRNLTLNGSPWPPRPRPSLQHGEPDLLPRGK